MLKKVVSASSVSQIDAENSERLERVMAFQFPPLIHRMIDKYGWTEEHSLSVFEDTKRFLFLCGTVTDGPVAPSEVIDEVWHNFILFTEEYFGFCKTHFDRFIHHRPRKRNDQPSKVNLAKRTLELAEKTFGELSPHWSYPKKANACSNCAGSTNCQDSDCKN